MIRFFVNGDEHLVDVAEDTPLLYVLRNDLGLKATRFGCGEGACGACRVLVDGNAVSSCDLPLMAVAGKQVVTLEGLGSEERPHPIQRALLAEQALQCGYCISGIIISTVELLSEHPSPTESQVRAALDQNFCRCGSHNRIVRAVLKAAKEVVK